MTKQEKLDKIRSTIGTNPEIRRVTYRGDLELMSNPVMIGDVLKHWNGMTTVMKLTQGLRKYLDQPIDNQPNNCIDYIYSLITK